MNYNPRKFNLDPYSAESNIDPLSDHWLPELRKDIPYFRELGINAISVNHKEASNNPTQALKLLRDAGIHVIITLLTDLRTLAGRNGTAFDEPSDSIDIQELYSPDRVLKMMTIINQTADFENVLGYSLDFSILGRNGTTRIASLHRAAVRDAKHFLALRGGRQIPIGASVPDIMPIRKPGMAFLAAGEPAERIDFFSFDCYSWVNKSSFKISGYQNLVEAYGDSPLPMFFSEYGANMGFKAREFNEVECLFSPDMTGVFSGGFVQTYNCSRMKHKPGPQDDGGKAEERRKRKEKEDLVRDGDEDDDSDDVSDHDDDDEPSEDEERDDVGGYDLMRVEEDRTRVPKKDFWNYKAKLELIDQRSQEEVTGRHERKDYENWRGELGSPSSWWLADPAAIPSMPLAWDEVLGELGRTA